MSKQNNRFCFVAPCYNASEYVARMLHSVCGQSYENWRLILIDDVSSTEHRLKTNEIVWQFKRMIGDSSPFKSTDQEPKITFVQNQNSEKLWEVANVLRGIKMCEDEDIVCRIDADDWLTDLDALHIINEYYEHFGCDAAWTAHRWSYTDKNISSALPKDADPYTYPWVSSHLKTFRKRLLNGVNDENFRGEDGNYIRRAGDQAIYLPALKNAKNPIFIPRVMYHYTINDVPETYQTDDAKFQFDEALFLRKRGFVK